MTVREKILRLQSLISEEVNEIVVVESGEELLGSLRNDWRVQEDAFSEEDVAALRRIGESVAALKRFIEEQEELPYLSTKEEADEGVGRLYYIVEKVDGLRVSSRVNKEIRELLEKRTELPSAAVSQRTSETRRAIASLHANAPTCRKCGSKMVLREGNGDYFWGCSRFPNCWGKKRLTAHERNAFPV